MSQINNITIDQNQSANFFSKLMSQNIAEEKAEEKVAKAECCMQVLIVSILFCLIF